VKKSFAEFKRRLPVKLYLILAAILFFIFFSNDFGLVDIQKTAIILAVGVDKSEEGYTLTTQIAVPQSQQGQTVTSSVQIQAGSATATASPLTGYRNYFYGTTSGTPPTGTAITSAFVRGLTASNRAYAANTFTLDVPAGATGVYIACIATRAGVTKVVNETALNADVTGSFTKQTSVDVEGANDYTAAPYNVWHYIPAVSYAQAARLKVTLG